MLEQVRRLLVDSGNNSDRKLAKALGTRIRQLGDFPSPSATIPETQPDLRQKTYQQLSLVRAPIPEEQEALQGTGLTFFQIEAKSLEQLERDNPDYFSYIDDSVGSSVYVPPSMVVAINLDQLFIPDSFGKSKTMQLAMIEKRSLARQRDFPDAREVMLPASALVQLHVACAKNAKFKGVSSFGDWFARSLDKNDAAVGWDRFKSRILVTAVDGGKGLGDIAALPAVVLIKNS